MNIFFLNYGSVYAYEKFQVTSRFRGPVSSNLAISWWKEPDMGEREGCAAGRMWRSACAALCAPDAEEAWQQIVEASPPDGLWHSLRNCVAYQAGVWQNLLSKGMEEVTQPAAFKLAIVLRHTPSELAVRLLADLLRSHPQSVSIHPLIIIII
ncbi:hypothetical protein evm_014832 [Chilo suppressalis]|nr:hypothetical protein evm_014832 [Chilo suppressalis]